MSQRRHLDSRRRGLAEIREIMDSMRTLAFMETRKLGRPLTAQQALISDIETAAADLLAFHPEALPAARSDARSSAAPLAPVYLLVGTERGFCGDFNHTVVAALRAEPGAAEARLVVVGRRLDQLLADDPRVAARIDGANAAEELAEVLDRVAAALADLSTDGHPPHIDGIAHGPAGDIETRRLLPAFARPAEARSRYSDPPLLQLPPAALLAAITEHYLLAVLQGMLSASLLAENQRRVTHLEGAIRHLDTQSADLARRSNALRQEEIVEEIEVVLLSAAALHEGRQR